MAWEDIAFSAESRIPASAERPLILQPWFEHTAEEVLQKFPRDVRVVASPVRHTYLDYSYSINPWPHFWSAGRGPRTPACLQTTLLATLTLAAGCLK